MEQEQRPARSGRSRRKVYVILPVYNEAERIETLLDRIDESLDQAAMAYHVVLIDDASHDGTSEIVSRCTQHFPILVCRHDVNLGLGAAIRDGLVEAARIASDRDILVTMDADDTHAPGVILRMSRMILEGYDVVIASRYRPGSRTVGVPLSRRLLSRVGAWIFRTLFPIRGVRDYTCGYRAYRAVVIQDALRDYGNSFLNQDGFQCMVDILLKLRRRDLIFGEVPFILRYDIKEGGTKMNVRRTILQTLLLILRRLVRR